MNNPLYVPEAEDFLNFLKDNNLLKKYEDIIFDDDESFFNLVLHFFSENEKKGICTKNFTKSKDILYTFILVYLILNFLYVPQTAILGQIFPDDIRDGDHTYQEEFLTDLLFKYKDLIDNDQPEDFFVNAYKDMILSEGLSRIVVLDEEKLKKEDFFKKSLKVYDNAKKLAKDFLQDLVKFVNFVENQNI